MNKKRIGRKVRPQKRQKNSRRQRDQESCFDFFSRFLSKIVNTPAERRKNTPITSWERNKIEAISDEVAKRVIERYDISLDCLLYDTTNYFTQMSGQTESELSRYAHSKAGKHQLRHVGLALLCNRDEGVPLFHRLYSANTHDSKLFSQIQQELFQLLVSLRKGKERMTLVFDKGCNSPENFSEIDKSEFFFIGTLSTYHHPKLCGVPLSDYKEVDYEGKPLSAYRKTMEIYGKDRAVVLTFNPRTYKKKIHWMSRTILRTKRKLQELRRELKSADKRTTVQSVPYRSCV